MFIRRSVSLGMLLCSVFAGAASAKDDHPAPTKCEVVSVGQWHCIIDGKGYYCDTNKDPKPDKNCVAAKTLGCPWTEDVVPEGRTVIAYKEPSVPFEQTCEVEERTCQDGVLTGSYEFAACIVEEPANCEFAGETVAHGESVRAFLTRGGLCESCDAEIRACSNGVLSGSYTHSSCSTRRLRPPEQCP